MKNRISDPLEQPAFTALALEMARHGTDPASPPRSVMAMLGDRWTSLILLVLRHGDLRHADLRRVLAALSYEQDISQRVLTLKLRALERDGFVIRTVTDDIPPKVSYRLSDLGIELAAESERMIAWINDRSSGIIAARDRYDHSRSDSY
ncbi:winged helix-turn-helix transcriptional regulator [Sphingobium lactosutens]|uniref:HTH hxlR-type domain-containing protein n=1 Tax=Sphingobium lactosutens DS20 TaxID=1331060 RepID=T0HL27_9SPHN|nr:winged helix-turn-helix transcriptional regulator [Sphingobium lactosutens]EQB12843.1 hypothetical protein RLDS_18890 [Sphingobium lactosutens DS20]